MTRGLIAGLAALVCAGSAQADSSVASNRGLEGLVTIDRLPVPDDAVLQMGRLVWAENCSNCHAGNKAIGAPKITSLHAWAPRIEKGMAVLLDHALNGFVGPKYTQMPARGANADLTDEEVAAAVAFMVWSSGGAAAVQDYLTHAKGSRQ